MGPVDGSSGYGRAIDPEPMSDVAAGQLRHWDSTFASHDGMFGAEPSEAARIAAEAFLADDAHRLLELGAGQGRDTFFFADAGVEVVALDGADSAVRIIASAAETRRPRGNVTVSRHDVHEALPFEDANFDACFSHMLFCMALTTTDLETLSAEVRRVVRPGGLVVYTVRHVGDAHYNAGTDLGDDMFENGGFVVHFFDRALVERLAHGYELLDVSEFSEGALPRRLWRVTMRVN